MLIGLLEDDPAIQEMLRLLLQGEGYEVVAYESAEICLACLGIGEKQVDAPRPDLLIVDFYLTKSISGLDIIQRIRATQKLASLPVILITASAFLNKEDLLRLHATLLPKPFDIDEIIRLIGTLTRP